MKNNYKTKTKKKINLQIEKKTILRQIIINKVNENNKKSLVHPKQAGKQTIVT